MSKQFHSGMYPKEMILWVYKGTCKGFGSTLSVYPCECAQEKIISTYMEYYVAVRIKRLDQIRNRMTGKIQ